MAFLNTGYSAPPTQPFKERPSPHKLSVCALIKIYQDILRNEPGLDVDETTTARFVSFLHHQINDTDRGEETSLVMLSQHLDDALSNSTGGGLRAAARVGHLFNQILGQCCGSPDDLMDLIGELGMFLSNGRTNETQSGLPTVGWSSTFGIFVRKFVLSIKLGGFTVISNLYDDVVAYVEGDSLTPMDRSPSSSLCQDQSRLDRSNTEGANEVKLSSRQLQLYLYKKALDLEKQVGKVSYEQVETEIQSLLALDEHLPQAMFVRSLNCTYHGDFAGALDAHYRYFDYATRFGGPNPTSTNAGRHDGSSSQPQNNIAMRIQLHVAQHAVLNKARLHFQFGQYEAAASSIEETFRLAQDHSNTHTITLALAWQYQVMLCHHQSKAINALRRCLSLCENEASVQYEVEATAKLNLARSLALMPSLPRADLSLETTSISGSGGGTGGGSLLSTRGQIWSALSSVSANVPDVIAIDLQSISNASTNPNPSDHHVSSVVSHQSDSLQATRELVAAGVFAAGGHARLSLLSSLAMLATNRSAASANDVVVAVSNIARYQFEHHLGGPILPDARSKLLSDPTSNPTNGLFEAIQSLLQLKQEFPYSSSMTSGWCKLATTLLLRNQLNRRRISSQNSRSGSRLLSSLPISSPSPSLLQYSLMSHDSSLVLSDSVSPCRHFVSPSSSSFIASYLPFYDTDQSSSNSSTNTSVNASSSLSFNEDYSNRSQGADRVKTPKRIKKKNNNNQQKQSGGRSDHSADLTIEGNSGDVNAPFDDDHFNALVNEVMVYIAHKRYSAALKLTLTLQAACRDRSLHVPMGDLLLLECQIRHLASPQQPLSSVTCIMRCLALSGGPCENSVSSRVHSSQHTQAMTELAFTFYKLDQPAHASALLKGIMPKIMEHAPIIARGRAMLLSGKCYLKQLQKLSTKEAQMLLLERIVKTLTCAQGYLEKAIGEVGSIEALRETYYLISRAYQAHPVKSSHNVSMRDAYSQLFLETRI